MSFGGYNQAFLDALPVGVYGCLAPDGQILFANRRATELWGRQPVFGEDYYCASVRLYLPDGSWLPHAECPMAIAVREGRGCKNRIVTMERPDGSRVRVVIHVEPFRDESSGRVVGAVNVFHETPDQ